MGPIMITANLVRVKDIYQEVNAFVDMRAIQLAVILATILGLFYILF